MARGLHVLSTPGSSMKLATLIAPALETALNTYLRLDVEMAGQLNAISGRLILLEVVGLEITLLVRVLNAKVQVSEQLAFEPDAIIRGSPLALVRLGLAADVPSAVMRQDVEIRGDAEVGRVFRDVLAGVEIDWEEVLARRVGDIPAHQIGNAVRTLVAALSGAADRLRMDLSEYLQEEARVIPTRIEVEQFMDDVDSLCADLDRLEARLMRLPAATPSGSVDPQSEV
jgi:ubiquinone biosynthesis protein UbiJ